MRRLLIVLALAAAAAELWTLERPERVRAVGPPEAGAVRFVRDTDRGFEPFLRSRRYVAFMREKFWRVHTYSPYFDHRLAWFRDPDGNKLSLHQP